MDMALQPDGKILAAGFAQTAPLVGSGEQDVRDLRAVNFALARYLTTGAPQPASTIQFSAPSYSVNENANSITITVTRTGDTSGAASVDYATTDNRAEQKSDYTFAAGSLRFAAGEASKAFTILVTNDAFSESGPESLILSLSNPGGASLGNPALASVTINDDEIAGQPQPNPVGDAQFFARQHYADFLNREPDPSGLQFWTNEIVSCGADAQCVEVKRINVSAAFFLSIEFQETGYFVHRLHKVAYNNLPGKPVPVRREEFVPDSQAIAQGIAVGIGDWQQQLEANKTAFVNVFTSRPRFTVAFPSGISAAEFVDTLNANASGALSQSERDALVAELNLNSKTRAQVLRAVAEDVDFVAAEKNRAFVLAQYFGYLRRNPDDVDFRGLPDPNFDGYNFWLSKLNQFNGNFVEAEMVEAFITSIEYRRRFE